MNSFFVAQKFDTFDLDRINLIITKNINAVQNTSCLIGLRLLLVGIVDDKFRNNLTHVGIALNYLILFILLLSLCFISLGLLSCISSFH